ncbi:MAG: hypothetical protein QOC87_1207 [Actinomycetota bacterium]|nr:hypothetical protein [Actinomycetota bacterium]
MALSTLLQTGPDQRKSGEALAQGLVHGQLQRFLSGDSRKIKKCPGWGRHPEWGSVDDVLRGHVIGEVAHDARRGNSLRDQYLNSTKFRI